MLYKLVLYNKETQEVIETIEQVEKVVKSEDEDGINLNIHLDDGSVDELGTVNAGFILLPESYEITTVLNEDDFKEKVDIKIFKSENEEMKEELNEVKKQLADATSLINEFKQFLQSNSN